MSRLDLTQLEYFADVVELGGFTAAAQRRGVTQPAVSMQVRALERRLGVRLVERIGRSVAATRAGLELLNHARSIRTEVECAIAAMTIHKENNVGRVRLGTGATACIHLLPPLLGHLRKCHPGIEITVQTGNTDDVVTRVEEGTLDIGLVTFPIRSRSLDLQEVYTDDLVAVISAETHVPAGPLTAAVLSTWPLVLYDAGSSTRRLIDRWFAASGVHVRPTMELGSVEAIKEMVSAGLGASILPALAVQGRGGAADLTVRPLDTPLARTLGVIVRRDRVVDWALRVFLQGVQSLSGGGNNSAPLDTLRHVSRGSIAF